MDSERRFETSGPYEVKQWDKEKWYYDEPIKTTIWGKEVYLVGEVPRIGTIRPCYVIWEELDGQISEGFIDKEGYDKGTIRKNPKGS